MSSAIDTYRSELDSLRFSDDALGRMTARLEHAAAQMETAATTADDANGILQMPSTRTATESPHRIGPRNKRPAHRILRIAASIAIAAGLGLGATGAYAAATQRSLSAVFSDLFGGAPAQTEVIDKIGHPLGASAASNGVTVTADAVIGSANSCTMVFSISRDDGKPFTDLAPAADSTYPLLWEASDIRIDGLQSMGGNAYFYDADPSDASIQYVYTISNATMFDGNGLTGRTARVRLRDLAVASEHDDRTEVVATGSWNLKFQLDYQDSSIALQAGQGLELNGMETTVDKLSVSSVGASITYTINAVSSSSQNSEEPPSDKLVQLPFTVTFKDGRVEDGTDADASTHEHGGTTTVTKSFIFSTIASTDDIASVTVGDQVIPVP